MRRLTDLPVGTEIEIDSTWAGRVKAEVTDPPEWVRTVPTYIHYVCAQAETENHPMLYAPGHIFIA